MIIKRLICKLFGHKWEYYMTESFKGALHSYDFEQAGYCTRCGFDTHGKYEVK